MPIEHRKGGTIITGESINYVQLLAQRGAVRLEIAGMRVSRGRKLWTVLAEHHQIKPKTAKAVLAWLEAKIAELQPQQEHITEDGKRIVNGQEVQ